MEPQTDATFPMGVTVNSDWKVEVVEPESWAGVILECPGKISNGLPKGMTSQVMVDTANKRVVSLVSNPAEEERQERREDAESRRALVDRVVNQLGPYVEFAQSAFRHFEGAPANAQDKIKWYLADTSRYTVTGANEEYNFTLDIDPPAAEFRAADDTEDNWTIGGGITQWTPEGYAETVRIWHFGPVTAQY